MERAYFERMVQAHSAPDQEQYLRHVAEADALLRQHRERRVLGTIQSSKSIESSERRNKMDGSLLGTLEINIDRKFRVSN